MTTKILREAFPTLKIEQSLTADADHILVHRVTVNNKRARASVCVAFEKEIDQHNLDAIVYALQNQVFDECELTLNLQILSRPEHHEQESENSDDMPLEARMAQISDDEFAQYQAAYEAELEEIRRLTAESLKAETKPKKENGADNGKKKFRPKFAPKDEKRRQMVHGNSCEKAIESVEALIRRPFCGFLPGRLISAPTLLFSESARRGDYQSPEECSSFYFEIPEKRNISVGFRTDLFVIFRALNKRPYIRRMQTFPNF